MLEPTNITSDFAVAAQLNTDDFPFARSLGFRTILNVRPDEEEGEHLRSEHAAGLAEANGLEYVHIPAANHAIFEPEIIDAFEQALITTTPRVLAHCKSGTRATILWAMVAARHRPVEEVITTLQSAGEDLAFLEQELRDQAGDASRSLLRMKDNGLLRLGSSSLIRGA